MINNQCFVFVLKQRNGEKIYFGLLEIPVKKRYNNIANLLQTNRPTKTTNFLNIFCYLNIMIKHLSFQNKMQPEQKHLLKTC